MADEPKMELVQPESSQTPPPQEIELTEVESLKLTALQATVGKLMAESQIISMQIRELQKEINMRQQAMPKLAMEERQVLSSIAQRYELKDLSAYSLDLEQGKGFLKPPTPSPRPPKG